MLYDRIFKEYQNIQTQITSLEQKLKSFPKGKLICCHHGKHCKYYQSDGHTKTYIPKKNRSLAEQLAVKKYLSSILADLKQEQLAIEFYLRHHRPASNKPEQFLKELPGYRALLAPYFKPLSQELLEWKNAAYEPCPKHPEHLIHETSSGHLVRSKSESMIAHFLYINKIPYRYESPLHLHQTTFYPDFTIRHPITGETYYWEHFGLMSDPAYCRKTSSKLQFYITNGIIPSIQLITTYEMQEHPLTTETIRKTIETYFL